MKKNNTATLKRWGCSALLLTILILACQEDHLHFPDTIEDPHNNEIRHWFEYSQTNVIKLPIITEREEHVLAHPNWELIKKDANRNFEVFECELETSSTWGYMTSSSANYNLAKKSSLSRLVIRSSKVSQDREAFIMTLIRKTDTLTLSHYCLHENSLLKKCPDFSGFELHYDLAGNFLRGWEYKQGKRGHSLSVTDNNIGLKNSTKKPDATAIYTWHEQTKVSRLAAEDTRLNSQHSFYVSHSEAYYNTWWYSPYWWCSRPVDSLSDNISQEVDKQRLQTALDLLRSDCAYKVIDDALQAAGFKLSSIRINPNLGGYAGVSTYGDLIFRSNDHIDVNSLKHEWVHLYQKYIVGINIHSYTEEGNAEFQVALLQDILGMYFGTAYPEYGTIGIHTYALVWNGFQYVMEVTGTDYTYHEKYHDWLYRFVDYRHPLPTYIPQANYEEHAKAFGITNKHYHENFYYYGYNTPYALEHLLQAIRKHCTE